MRTGAHDIDAGERGLADDNALVAAVVAMATVCLFLAGAALWLRLPLAIAAAPAPAPTEPGATTRAPAAAAPALDPAGTWQWTANCALLLRVSGWTTFSPRGDGTWNASAGNSLGFSANGSATLSGSTLTVRLAWSNGIREVSTMRISGNSFTSTSSAGCAGSGHR